MPITNVNSAGAEKGPGGGGRTTFRPPWVKDGPQPIPMPKAPWSKRQSLTTPADLPEAKAEPTPEVPQLKSVKLQSKEVKVPVVSALKKTPASQLTATKAKVNEDTEGVKNGLQNLLRKTESVNEDDSKSLKSTIDERMAAKKAAAEAAAPGSLDKPGKFVRPVLKKVAKVEAAPAPPPPAKVAPPKPVVVVPVKKVESESEEEETDSEEEETETETETESEDEPVVVKKAQPAAKPAAAPKATPSKPAAPVPKSNASGPPPPPPPPPMSGAPPPPPPPPGLVPPPDFQKKPISNKHKEYLERLKNRPRKRPDWSDMMKEVESGRKLRHVQCNDRSSPILTSKSITNIKGQFVYETEKANVHNALLKQIQFGVRLKNTKTNDRSKPILDGLRKFRRQMTIEEQILKSESRAQLNVAPEVESEDEMDDIDKLRDDLQSSKQMLALELRSKEAQERENKRLLSKIQMLEAELERERSKGAGGGSETKSDAPAKEVSSASNDALVESLKSEAEEAQKTSKMLETKYQDVAEKLDTAKLELDEQRRTIANLERKLAQQPKQNVDERSRRFYDRDSSESPEPDRFNCNYMWQASGTAAVDSRRQSEAQQKDSSPEPELDVSDEEDEEEDEEKKAERIARRLAREVKMMSTRLSRLKDKERAAKKERENLRDAMKKNQGLLKIEHKKFKKLQREVDKMAALMKDDDDEDEDAEPKEEPEEEEVAEEESEEESESEESEDETDSESSESEAEDSPDEAKKANYDPRIKRHDGRLAALKKGNYLVQANVDRLQDEINSMREKSVTLQADLDSVLSELG